MSKFGWAFIGAGAIANTVAEEITSSGTHEIVSVYSRTKSKAEKLATRYGGQVCSTLTEAVTRKGVQCVYLATPHSCHYSEIVECMHLGVPVLSEKAFTINSAQTRAIMTNSGRNSYVSEAMWTRYNPITLMVKGLVKSGELGKIERVKASFCYPYYLSDFSRRVVYPEYGGGALLDIGVYPISYMTMLFGKPKDIKSKMRRGPHGTDMSDSIRLTYESGTVADIRVSLRGVSTCSLSIKAEKGSVFIPLFYRPTRAYVKTSRGRKVWHAKAGYIHEFNMVAQEVLDGKMESSYIPLSDSLDVMEIMDEIRQHHNLTYPENIEKL